MPMRAEIMIRGDQKIMSRMTQWARRAGDTVPVMEAISEGLEAKERDLFESEGATGRHGAWQELEESTKEQKESQAQYPEILRRTDALFDSLTDSSDENAIRQIGPGFLRFGSKLPYAEIHQKGFTDRGGNHVEARRPIDFTQRDRAESLALISAWITGRVAAGRRFRVPIKPSFRMKF